jgi:hypothetical protein
MVLTFSFDFLLWFSNAVRNALSIILDLLPIEKYQIQNNFNKISINLTPVC